MSNPLELKSAAITGEIMGVGTTTQAKSLAEALDLPMIPSGGAFRRHISHTWNVFRDNANIDISEPDLWQEFNQQMVNGSIEIIPIEQKQQSEAELKEFDRVEIEYGNEESRKFLEVLIDKKGIDPLLDTDDPKVAEGKLIIIAEKLGLNFSNFNDLVVRYCLTVRNGDGKIDLYEVGKRILEREIKNGKITPPKEDREKEELIIRTVSNSLVRNEGHWKRWENVYGVKWSDIGKESEKADVYTINTNHLTIDEVQLAMRLAYLHSVPRSASILLPKINDLINQIEAKREIQLVFADIKKYAPAVIPAIISYLTLDSQ